ncbi:hypothetical protein [Streptomyces lydicus]|uniref:hypothetical protein n=1 Tax=Streptomyces lydicus TaxID=47763 RepID=UPI0037A72EC4
MGHRDHPLLGRRVVDHGHGDRIGVLRAIAPEYDPGRLAIVTDIRKGVPYLRAAGLKEWPAPDPDDLRVSRSRAERIADGDPR